MPSEAGIIILVLQRRTLRPREVKKLAQVVWLVAQSWHSEPDAFDPNGRTPIYSLSAIVRNITQQMAFVYNTLTYTYLLLPSLQYPLLSLSKCSQNLGPENGGMLTFVCSEFLILRGKLDTYPNHEQKCKPCNIPIGTNVWLIDIFQGLGHIVGAQ